MKKMIWTAALLLLCGGLTVSVSGEESVGFDEVMGKEGYEAVLVCQGKHFFNNMVDSSISGDEETIKLLDYSTFETLMKDQQLEPCHVTGENTRVISDGTILTFVGQQGQEKSLFLGKDGILLPCRAALYSYANQSVHIGGFEFLYDASYCYDTDFADRLWQRGESLIDGNGKVMDEYHGAPLFYEEDADTSVIFGSKTEGGEPITTSFVTGILPFDVFVMKGGAPWDRISREEFCEMAFNCMRRTEKAPEPVTGQFFTDTDNPRINALYQLGLVAGRGDGAFYPEEPITREEAAVLANRIYDFYGWPRSESQEHVYEDEAEISDWAVEAVRAAYDSRIMVGGLKNYLRPKDNLARYHTIYLMRRVIKMNRGES